MSDLNEEEKSLLEAATKLRQLVRADVENAFRPALLALRASLLPSLPDVSLSRSSWEHVATYLRTALADASDKSASTTELQKTLEASKVPNAAELSSRLSAVVAAHRQTPNRKLESAVEMVSRVQDEVALLREFA